MEEEMKKNKTYISLSLIFISISMTLLLVNYACQQKKEKNYVIGYVNPNIKEEEGAQGFLRNMPKFGFIEGKNVTYIKFEGRDTQGMEAALRDMAAKRVDLIFTMTTPAAQMAKQATEGTNIPVVHICYDPVRSGIVKSLTNPGGNITGVQLSGSTQKSLEFLRAIAPHAKHIFVPVKFDTRAALQAWRPETEAKIQP
jgi:putative ABC transport system substrate-binding protein